MSDPRLAHAIRFLAMDAVQKANSGHPGMPMGMAEIAVALWGDHVKHNPADPQWPDRDRVIVSNGHGSMLLYSVLHLTGYDLPISELQRFRQMHSRTPGHPEYGAAPGVETTTGPLGQGLANAVGMAIAEKVLAAHFNRPGHTVVDHHTYVLLGDGCLMEGISHEVCSLAGTLRLGKLICLYDDNGISIDGHVKGWFTDDTVKRFEAYGWHVVAGVDGHDVSGVSRAIASARTVGDRPSLICCRTVIGRGSPNKAGTHDVHGAPLGEAEIAAARAELGWDLPPFSVPAEVAAAWDARAQGQERQANWTERFAAYTRSYPELALEFSRRQEQRLPEDWSQRASELVAAAQAKAANVATRKASQMAIEALGPGLPELFGGSADLAGSNLTLWSGSKGVSAEGGGNYVYYGVREFGMAAIMNGIALHRGLRPYGGTFLVFSDYARNALRMAALMKVGSVFVFTHDSIGLGEDGPTHQPVEQVASLRLIPNMHVWRPADVVETMAAWIAAVERRDGPTSLILSRQNLAPQPRSAEQVAAIRRGGYVLREASGGVPRVALLATGSEVSLALAAQEALEKAGTPARVVSMPCVEIFSTQDAAWRASVLPEGVPRVAIEAGATAIWHRFVGLQGAVVGMDSFGESAPAGALFQHFGFTVDKVVQTVRGVL
ncbi:transketolase [Burkholderiales bacterium]|nr:MAG: transketolase [Burkholderiales bacterium]CAG0996083.1 transketolase [Burkholderiales bacterium]